MKGSADVLKGRVEEAAGVLANNDKLRAKGQKDQAVGHVKQVTEGCVQKVKDVAKQSVDKAKDVAKNTVDRAKGRT